MTDQEKSLALYLIDLLCDGKEPMALEDDAIFRARGKLEDAGPAYFTVLADGLTSYNLVVIVG